jgi:hypothetical protein
MADTNNEWFRGYKNGRLRLVNDIRDLLENAEHRVSILSILAMLERVEQELIEAEAASYKQVKQEDAA